MTAAPAFLLGCHRTDHCRQYLFLLHRTLKPNCFKGQRSLYPEPPHHRCVTALITEGKCCLHRAHAGDRKIVSEWSAKTKSYTHAKRKQLENSEPCWKPCEQSQNSPCSSSIVLCSAVFGRSWSRAAAGGSHGCAVWDGGSAPKPPRHLAGMRPGCAWAQLERRKSDKTASHWSGTSTSLPFCQQHDGAVGLGLQTTQAASWHLQINTGK